MSFLSKELELKKFIHSKILSKKQINYNKLINFITKVLKDSTLKSFKRLQQYHWIIECNTIVYNVFWIIFNFTYNIKLTFFLCERAIMLFNEYIDLAKHTFKDNNQEFVINSTDVKLFIYKRTIGPIKIKTQTQKFKKMITPIQKSSNLIKLLLNKLICKINTHLSQLSNIESVIEKNMSYFEKIIPDILLKIFQNNLTYNLDLHKINNIETEHDIVRFIHKIKYDCEILYYIFKSMNKDCDISQKMFNQIIVSSNCDEIETTYFTQKSYDKNKIIYIQNNINKFKQLIQK